MNEEKPIRLIRACVEDTGVLASLLSWFDNERDSALNRLGDAEEVSEIYKLQGEARCMRRLRLMIAGMTKAKAA